MRTPAQVAHIYLAMARTLLGSAAKRLPVASVQRGYVDTLIADVRRVESLMRPDAPAQVPTALITEMLSILDHFEDAPTTVEGAD